MRQHRPVESSGYTLGEAKFWLALPQRYLTLTDMNRLWEKFKTFLEERLRCYTVFQIGRVAGVEKRRITSPSRRSGSITSAANALRLVFQKPPLHIVRFVTSSRTVESS